MTWNEARDLMLTREVAANGVFTHKQGSRERGNAWQSVADNLNHHSNFHVTNRSIRDRFNLLAKKYKSKAAKEIQSTGLGGGEPTELESLIEELIELSEECERRAEADAESAKASAEAEKKKVEDVRKTAMETMGQTKKRKSNEDGTVKEKTKRRTGSEGMEWLREKSAKEAEFREKELENLREERELKRQEVLEGNNLLKRQLELQAEAQQQQQQQQTMMQQQLLAVMQQQQQQMQLFMNMFGKLPNGETRK